MKEQRARALQKQIADDEAASVREVGDAARAAANRREEHQRTNDHAEDPGLHREDHHEQDRPVRKHERPRHQQSIDRARGPNRRGTVHWLNRVERQERNEDR